MQNTTSKVIDFVVTLVNGYIKLTCISMIPVVLRDIIIEFYGYCVPCNMYRMDFKIFNDNPYINLYPNGTEYALLINDKYKMSIFQDDRMREDIICNNIINVVSRGVCANEFYVYTNDSNELLFCDPLLSSSFDMINIDMFKSNIIQIEYGKSHILFLSELGNVFGCGKNDHFQLTNESEINVNIDNIIQLNKIHNIKRICAGKNTSFILDKNNILYCFGSNEYGLLGINKSNEYELTGNIIKIENYNVKTMDCVYCHAGLITNNNIVYFWGYNFHGQCGTNDCNERIKPTKINTNNIVNNKNEIISEINCGSFHSIIKTNNNFYTFGDNTDDELLLDTCIKPVKIPTKIDKEYIKRKTGNNGDIIDLIPGDSVSFILQRI